MASRPLWSAGGPPGRPTYRLRRRLRRGGGRPGRRGLAHEWTDTFTAWRRTRGRRDRPDAGGAPGALRRSSRTWPRTWRCSAARSRGWAMSTPGSSCSAMPDPQASDGDQRTPVDRRPRPRVGAGHRAGRWWAERTWDDVSPMAASTGPSSRRPRRGVDRRRRSAEVTTRPSWWPTPRRAARPSTSTSPGAAPQSSQSVTRADLHVAAAVRLHAHRWTFAVLGRGARGGLRPRRRPGCAGSARATAGLLKVETALVRVRPTGARRGRALADANGSGPDRAGVLQRPTVEVVEVLDALDLVASLCWCSSGDLPHAGRGNKGLQRR